VNELSPERWEQLWRVAAERIPPPEYFQRLLTIYSEPHRRYHNQRHIADCLTEFDRVKSHAADPTAIELAIWFHDAIYDPRAADNEERSAELAKRWLKEFGASNAVADAVCQLVLATKHHDGSLHADAPLLVDVDLSILGQPPERFWKYERQIRAEYSWVEESMFASKRAEILEGFLARERIYRTGIFFQELEAQARKNLKASVQRLRAARAD
jgi:predicted metal-dependent HD superfamily phosphohydrolase